MFKFKKVGESKQSFILGLVSGIAVISTLAFIILLIVFLGGKTDSKKVAEVKKPEAQAAQEANKQQAKLAAVPPVTDKDYIRGDKNAPVTLIEYSDFECPYCARHVDTLDKILSEYKGKVRLVYRNFPLSFHPHSKKAAEAAECAGEQGKFWEMHDEIFKANKSKTMGVDKWKKVAANLGLDTAKFNKCLDSDEYASKITSQMRDGAAAGVKGTPATFVNGQLVSGAVPYESFKQIIDTALSK